ncbi:hypothetical protein CEK26_007415 [Fusarium fujikuroi]|uniref:Uncharacterized protein n=1 Tax=Fusarium fujikuroi TaxID=5127 RepID=A0A5Q3FU06_FUSFU|nr:hypothetical protein CEK27_007435 [Fusarium fujikuroi]QGI80740.1 hypothetical protein CEK25_007469 [Fusarium fujikuroi]QGI94346.1 hypothetical protein CEK26_007415 [Fusarium fujikuroi]VTT68928.1 unnamed protein product [Fusarium fujikuroi]VZI15231.1 unnamed protein product [Fusarium fujikuroi]
MTGERRDDEEKERKGASHDQICLHGSNGWMNVITLDKSLACLVFACQSQLRPSRLVRTCAAERPPAGIIVRKTIPGDAKLVVSLSLRLELEWMGIWKWRCFPSRDACDRQSTRQRGSNCSPGKLRMNSKRHNLHTSVAFMIITGVHNACSNAEARQDSALHYWGEISQPTIHSQLSTYNTPVNEAIIRKPASSAIQDRDLVSSCFDSITSRNRHPIITTDIISSLLFPVFSALCRKIPNRCRVTIAGRYQIKSVDSEGP